MAKLETAEFLVAQNKSVLFLSARQLACLHDLTL